MKTVCGALPDAELTLDGEACGADVLVHRGTFRGTLNGSFLGLPPTGREVAFPFVAVLHFKDGLMEGERLFFEPGHVLRAGGPVVGHGAGSRADAA